MTKKRKESRYKLKSIKLIFKSLKRGKNGSNDTTASCTSSSVHIQLTTIRTHNSNAKTRSVQSIMCVGDDGGSVGELKFVTFVEFMASIGSLIVFVGAAKIDDDLSEKLATKDSVRSKLNDSMMVPT